MNDRLRDRLHDPDPVLARAAELVASVPAMARCEIRKERVRRAILATEPRRVWLPVLLRPGVAIPVLLFAGAVMGATVGRPLIVQTYHRLTKAMEAPGSEGRGLAEPSGRQQPEITDPPLMPENSPPPEASGHPIANTARPHTGVSRPLRAATRVAPTTTRPIEDVVQSPSAPSSEPSPQPAPQATAAPAQETALMMTAVRALRRDHDPVRAGTLLESYLRRYPNGALVEEALALSIEAASARGDGRAATLARTYLQRYPQGRFQRAARAAAE